MAVTEELELFINGKVQDALNKNAQVAKSIESLEKQSAKSSAATAASFKAAFAGIAAAFGIQGAAALKELAKQSAQFQEQSDVLTKKFGVDADKLLNKLREASDGQISNFDLIRASSRAMALGVSTDSETLAKLLEFATAKADELGQDAKEVFDGLVESIGKGTPKALTGLGISAEAFKKSGIQVDGFATKTQLLNTVLGEADGYLAAVGKSAPSMADRLDRAGATFDNLKLKVGDALLQAIDKPLKKLEELLNSSDKIEQFGQVVSGVFAALKLVFTAAAAPLRAQFAVIQAVISTAITAVKDLDKAVALLKTGNLGGASTALADFGKNLAKLPINIAKNVKDSVLNTKDELVEATTELYGVITKESVKGEKDLAAGKAVAEKNRRRQEVEEARIAAVEIAKGAKAASEEELKAKVSTFTKLREQYKDNAEALRVIEEQFQNVVAELDEKTKERLKGEAKKKYDEEVTAAKAAIEQITDVRGKASAADLQRQSDQLEEQLKLYANNADARVAIEKKLADVRLDLEEAITDEVADAFNKIGDAAADVLDSISPVAGGVAKFVLGAAQALQQGIVGVITFLLGKIAELIDGVRQAEERISEIQQEQAEIRNKIALQQAENRIKAIDSEIKALQDQTAEEKALSDFRSEQSKKELQERAAAGDEEAKLELAAIAAREAQNEKIAELEKQKIEEQKKAAEIKKKIAITETYIDENKAISAVPYTLFDDLDDKQKAEIHTQYSMLRDLLNLQSFARGTSFAPGGMALVGEQGPELVNLPRGAQVFPASKTEALLPALAGAVSSRVDRSVRTETNDNRKEINISVTASDEVEFVNRLRRQNGGEIF